MSPKPDSPPGLERAVGLSLEQRTRVWARFTARMLDEDATVADIMGPDSMGDWSADRAELIRLADESGVLADSERARNLPHAPGYPCRWWYAPEVGLDRPRYPWDPEDLVEQLRAQQESA